MQQPTLSSKRGMYGRFKPGGVYVHEPSPLHPGSDTIIIIIIIIIIIVIQILDTNNYFIQPNPPIAPPPPPYPATQQAAAQGGLLLSSSLAAAELDLMQTAPTKTDAGPIPGIGRDFLRCAYGNVFASLFARLLA